VGEVVGEIVVRVGGRGVDGGHACRRYRDRVPELPEVETIRRQLALAVRGRRIVGGDAHESPKFATAPRAVGTSTVDVRRRGRSLLFDLPAGRELLVLLGMSGPLALGAAVGLDVGARWHVVAGRSLR